MAAYFVLGIEPFKVAEVRGSHTSRQTAIEQAESLKVTDHPQTCQRIAVMASSKAKKAYTLYT